MVGFIWFVVCTEVEWDGCLSLIECTWWVYFFGHGDEIIMWSSFINGMRLKRNKIDEIDQVKGIQKDSLKGK
jgi:hypothetical protein